jgi:hypothetical protein
MAARTLASIPSASQTVATGSSTWSSSAPVSQRRASVRAVARRRTRARASGVARGGGGPRPRRDARPASPDDGGAPSHSLCRSAAPLRRLTVYGGMLNSASKHLRAHDGEPLDVAAPRGTCGCRDRSRSEAHLHLDGEEQRTRPREEAHARGGDEQ